MINTEDTLEQLLKAPRIVRTSLGTAPTAQGVYVLWFVEEPPVCLKVGIAGPRQGKGLRERLSNHYRSHTSNSVLARHLAADSTSRWCDFRDFTNRERREAFIATECYFQAITLQTESRWELEQVEASIIARLRPVYLGRVGNPALKRVP